MFFKNTSERLLWKLIFFTFFEQFFTPIPEIIGTFREGFIFQIIEPLGAKVYYIDESSIILMSLATERNSNYIDKIFMQA